MRFARGTKVQIAWIDSRGRNQVVRLWWNQVDAFICKYDVRQGTDFRVRGYGWKDWRAYDPRTQVAAMREP